MEKVLLITIQDYYNLGNRLQNYALQFVLEQKGFKVYNHMLVSCSFDNKSRLKLLLKRLFGIFNSKYKYLYSWNLRKKACIEFTNKYIHNHFICSCEKLNDQTLEDYVACIVGSDQVWHNWHMLQEELKYYYLEFVQGGKRLSYAPSFGFKEFPIADKVEHYNGLMGMNSLSCRETEGCDLIYELTGREAIKVLDPTLLLNSSDWSRLEYKPKFRVYERYLLVFTLGEISDDYEVEINRIAVSGGLEKIYINREKGMINLSISPCELIWLVHHATTVCTDSFHVAVFSILFERDLRVFERKGSHDNMFGRLHDLLKPLGLLKNVYGKGQKLSTKLSTDAETYLLKEKEKSLNYLLDSLTVLDNTK